MIWEGAAEGEAVRVEIEEARLSCWLVVYVL